MSKRTYPKAIHKVENTPRDDNIVVDSNEKRNDTWRDSNSAEPRMNRIPHA